MPSVRTAGRSQYMPFWTIPLSCPFTTTGGASTLDSSCPEEADNVTFRTVPIYLDIQLDGGQSLDRHSLTPPCRTCAAGLQVWVGVPLGTTALRGRMVVSLRTTLPRGIASAVRRCCASGLCARACSDVARGTPRNVLASRYSVAPWKAPRHLRPCAPLSPECRCLTLT